MPKFQFEVSVTPQYLPEQSMPEAGVFHFVYNIIIHNSGELPAQLICQALDHQRFHRPGSGGQGPGRRGPPALALPGESFEYQSQCRLATAQGSMEGSYLCISEEAETFDCPIPRFSLDATQFPAQDDDLAQGRVLH